MMALLSVAYELHDCLQVLYLDSTLSCIQWHDLLILILSILFHLYDVTSTLSLLPALLLCDQSAATSLHCCPAASSILSSKVALPHVTLITHRPSAQPVTVPSRRVVWRRPRWSQLAHSHRCHCPLIVAPHRLYINKPHSRFLLLTSHSRNQFRDLPYVFDCYLTISLSRTHATLDAERCLTCKSLSPHLPQWPARRELDSRSRS
jgi:hypothetical protein